MLKRVRFVSASFLISECDTRTDVRACIAYDDGTDLRSLTSSNPTDVISVLQVIGYGAARDILADLQEYSEPGGCPRIVAFLVRV